MRVESRSTLDHLQYLNVGFASTIRYKQNRNGQGILNQSVSEHLVGMLNILDVFKEDLNRKHRPD